MARRRLRWRFGFGEALEQSSLEDAHGTGVECYSSWKPRVTLAALSPFATCPATLPQPAIHVQDSDSTADLGSAFFLPPPMAPATTPLSNLQAGPFTGPPAPGPVLLLPPSAAQVISRHASGHIAEHLTCGPDGFPRRTRHREIPASLFHTHACLPPHPPVTGRHTSSFCLPVVGTSLAYLALPTSGCEDASPPQRRLP